jgi:hypothetical protein
MRYFTLTNGTALHFGGAADRYHKNIAALTLLRALQAEQRQATDLTADERLTLAHYSAFGESQLLNRAFEEKRDLATLVSEEEAQRIKRTALTAFYTPQTVLHELWGNLAPAIRAVPGPLQILEPAFGAAGMFVATMPQDIRDRSAITAVELDLVSSQIAAYLHPDVALIGGIGFEAADLPTDHYDLVISNVPFGDFKVFCPNVAEDYLKRCIHDFFIARSIKLTRPGGLVVVLTSYGTLDKRDTRTRAWIAERADLIEAIRFPQGAFAENSGTACGADLLILRRK